MIREYELGSAIPAGGHFEVVVNHDTDHKQVLLQQFNAWAGGLSAAILLSEEQVEKLIVWWQSGSPGGESEEAA